MQIIGEGQAGTSVNLLQDIFPSQEVLDDRLRDLPSNTLDPALAIVEPFIPPASLWGDTDESPIQLYDRFGMCEYSRIVNALLVVASENRDLVRQNMWLLRHFLILSIAATDRRMMPSATSGYFSEDVDPDMLQEIPTRVKALTAYLLSEMYDEGWHASVIQSFSNGKDSADMDHGPSSFVVDLLKTVTEGNSSRESRVLLRVLQHLLNGAATSDAEQWVSLAKRIEKQGLFIMS